MLLISGILVIEILEPGYRIKSFMKGISDFRDYNPFSNTSKFKSELQRSSNQGSQVSFRYNLYPSGWILFQIWKKT